MVRLVSNFQTDNCGILNRQKELKLRGKGGGILYNRCVSCKKAVRKELKNPYVSFICDGFHLYVYIFIQIYVFQIYIFLCCFV